MNPKNTPITGAELQTLREACGLSRDELGALCGVAPRTVKHWEHGRAGVPADVAEILKRIDRAIDVYAMEYSSKIIDGVKHYGFTQNNPVLTRFKSDDDLEKFGNISKLLCLGSHGNLIQRIKRILLLDPLINSVRIVWFDRSKYLMWNDLEDEDQKNFDSFTLKSVDDWANRQITAQALPHRGDQPPG